MWVSRYCSSARERERGQDGGLDLRALESLGLDALYGAFQAHAGRGAGDQQQVASRPSHQSGEPEVQTIGAAGIGLARIARTEQRIGRLGWVHP